MTGDIPEDITMYAEGLTGDEDTYLRMYPDARTLLQANLYSAVKAVESVFHSGPDEVASWVDDMYEQIVKRTILAHRLSSFPMLRKTRFQLVKDYVTERESVNE